MTAWAPNTHQRPQRGMTFERSVRSSRAAGWTGTAEEIGEAFVSAEVPPPIVGTRPARMLREDLTPQLLGDAERLDRSEARDTLAPIGVFGLPSRAPISSDVLADPSCNHA